MTSGSALIESILRISSHGVLSWHLDESVKPEQEQRLMDEFEQVAFAGLEPDQRNILWVRHSHAGHHELHFVLPRVELSSGKAFNPCPPGWQKHLAIASRAVMLIVLQETGLEINRAGKDYITVKDPESGEKLRLKGGIYAEHWNLELAGRALEGQDRTGTERTGSPDPVTVQRLEQELEPIVQSRAQYNRGRYPTPACQLEIERNFTLPDTEPRLWLEVPASPGHHSVLLTGAICSGWGLMSLAERKITTLHREITVLSERKESLEAQSAQIWATFKGLEPYRDQDGKDYLLTPGGLDYQPHGNSGQAGRLENSEEISHDRTGTTTGISAALATLERCTRELGAALVAFERLVERQIERSRERERQRNRGPGMGR